jgi:hypothetical protein
MGAEACLVRKFAPLRTSTIWQANTQYIGMARTTKVIPFPTATLDRKNMQSDGNSTALLLTGDGGLQKSISDKAYFGRIRWKKKCP